MHRQDLPSDCDMGFVYYILIRPLQINSGIDPMSIKQGLVLSESEGSAWYQHKSSTGTK